MIIKIIKMSKRKKNLHDIYIYTLKERGVDKIRYIGKTNNIKRRLREHLIESVKLNKSHKHKWINSVLENSGEIEINIIEVVDYDNWEEKEVYWINKIGISNLTNYIIGGGGGRPVVDYISYNNAKKWILDNKKYIDRKYKWDYFCKESQFPDFLPKCPEKVYKQEWVGYGDFLGTGKKSNKAISENFLDFKSSKKIVSKFNINNQKEWIVFCASGKKPKNIPSNPQKIYKKEWSGYKNWLSSEKFSNKNKLTYEEAKKNVHSLGLNTHKEWVEYFKNNSLDKIPFNPQRTYKENWEGWNMWLGSKNKYMDYEKAKNISQKINLKNRDEWFEYYDKNDLEGIPKHPQSVYSDKWINWKDWLGK
jgi:hypothetical protein